MSRQKPFFATGSAMVVEVAPTVTLRATVEIYYQLRRIALHKRSYKRHGFTTTAQHMPEGHQRYYERRGWTPEYFVAQAVRIGPCPALYVQALLKARQFTEQTYNACRGLLRLQQEFSSERLELACEIGLKSSTYNYKTIHYILVNNLDKTASIQTDLFRIPEHPNLRGPMLTVERQQYYSFIKTIKYESSQHIVVNATFKAQWYG